MITQGCIETFQNGSLQQKITQSLRLERERFIGQILCHIAVAARKRRNDFAGICRLLQRERCELQTRHPAFSARLQRADIFGVQRESHCLIQELQGFFFGEAQVIGADLGQLSAYAPASQREGRVGAADENEMQVRGEVVDQICNRIVNGLLGDMVIIVQDQDDILADKF